MNSEAQVGKAKEVEERSETLEERVARFQKVYAEEQITVRNKANKWLLDSCDPSYDCEEDCLEEFVDSDMMDHFSDGFAAAQQRMADWRYAEYKRNKAAGIAAHKKSMNTHYSDKNGCYVEGCTLCAIGSMNEVLEASFIADKKGRIVRRDTIVVRPYTEEQKAHMYMWMNLSDVDSNGRPILWMDEEGEHNKEVRNCPKIYKLPPFPGFPETKARTDQMIWHRMFQGGVYWDCDVYGIFNIETMYENYISGDENRTIFVITVLEPVLSRTERINELVYKEKFMRALFVDMTTVDINMEPYYGQLHDVFEPNMLESKDITTFLAKRMEAGLDLSYGEKPQMLKQGKKYDTQIKAELNLLCQSNGLPVPEWQVEQKMRGNAPLFHCTANFEGKKYVGTVWHSSKQNAQCEIATMIVADKERWCREKEEEDFIEEDIYYTPEPAKKEKTQKEGWATVQEIRAAKSVKPEKTLLDYANKRADFLQGVLLNQQQLIDNSIAAGRAQGYISQPQMLKPGKFQQSLVNRVTVAGAKNAENHGGSEPLSSDDEFEVKAKDHPKNKTERRMTVAQKKDDEEFGPPLETTEWTEEEMEAYIEDNATTAYVDTANVKHLEALLEADGIKEPTEEDMIKRQNALGALVGMPPMQSLWSPEQAKFYVEKCQEQVEKQKEEIVKRQAAEAAKQNKAPPKVVAQDEKTLSSVELRAINIAAQSTAHHIDRNRARGPKGFREMNLEMMKEIFSDWLKESYLNSRPYSWYSLKRHVRDEFALKGVDQKFWDYSTTQAYRQQKVGEFLLRTPEPEPIPVQLKKTEQTETFEKQKEILEEYENKTIGQRVKKITENVGIETKKRIDTFAEWWMAKPFLGYILHALIIWAGVSMMTSMMSFALVLGISPLFSLLIGVMAMVLVMMRGYMYAMFVSYAIASFGCGPWFVVIAVWTGITATITLLAQAAATSVRWKIRKLESAEAARIAREEMKEQKQGLIDGTTKAVGETIGKIASTLQFPTRTVSNLRALVGLVKDFPSAIRVIAEFWNVYFFDVTKCAAEADIVIWQQEEVGKIFILKGLKGHEIATRVIPSGFTFFLWTSTTRRFTELGKDMPQVPLNRIGGDAGDVILMKKDDIVMEKNLIIQYQNPKKYKKIKWETRAYDWLNRRVLAESAVAAPGIGYTYPTFVPAVPVAPEEPLESTAHKMDWFDVADKTADILSGNNEEETPQSHHLDAVRQLAAQFANYVQKRSQGIKEYVMLRKWWTLFLAGVGCAGFAFVSMLVWSYLKRQESEDEPTNTAILSDGTIMVDQKTEVVVHGEMVQQPQANVLKYDVDADFEIIKVRSPDGKYFGYDPERLNQEYLKDKKPGDVVPVKVWSNKGARELRMIVTESGEELQSATHASGKIYARKLNKPEDQAVKKEMKQMFKNRAVPLPPKREPTKVVSRVVENKTPIIKRSSEVIKNRNMKQQSIGGVIQPVFESQQAWKSTLDTRVNYCIFVCDRFVCQVTKVPGGIIFNKHFDELPDLKDGPLTLWNPRVGTSQAITWDWSKVENFANSKDLSYHPLTKAYSHLPCVDGQAMEMVVLPEGTYSGWIMGYDPDSRDGVPFQNQIEIVKRGNELHYFTDNKPGQCMSLIFLDTPKKQLVGWHKSGSSPGRKCTAEAVTTEIIDRCYSGQPDRLF